MYTLLSAGFFFFYVSALLEPSCSSARMMPIAQTCCFKLSNKTGTILIGAILLTFSVCFLFVTIGLVAGWEDFNTDFLDDRLSR